MCREYEGRIGCHIHCIETTPRSVLASSLEVAALEFSYITPFDTARVPWLEARLSGILYAATHHLPYLPEELRQIIVNYALALRPISIMGHQLLATDYVTQVCADGKPGVSSVKTSERIYARQVDFEGFQYVAHLKNKASDDRDILLFDPTLPNAIDTLYVANDPLGIRQLLFADSSQQCTVDEKANIWWRHVALEHLGGLIRCHGDVSTGLAWRDSRHACLLDVLGPEIARSLG